MHTLASPLKSELVPGMLMKVMTAVCMLFGVCEVLGWWRCHC